MDGNRINSPSISISVCAQCEPTWAMAAMERGVKWLTSGVWLWGDDGVSVAERHVARSKCRPRREDLGLRGGWSAKAGVGSGTEAGVWPGLERGLPGATNTQNHWAADRRCAFNIRCIVISSSSERWSISPVVKL
ncbi:hypothetical protein M758_4G021100 [Ceratodon purpureus]|nr:hypothetical protein M758_4G021100 [Ceratodon purpureus]